MNLRIGVDATCWQNNRGYGRHARALLTRLVACDAQNRYFFFHDSNVGGENWPPRAALQYVPAAAPASVAAAAAGHRSPRDLWRMSRALSTAPLDLIFFPTIYSYVPVWTRARKIVMVHDIIPELYPELTLPSREARLFWKAKHALGRRQADALVTVSEYSRRALARHFDISPEQISVVSEASDPVFRRLDHPRPTPRLQSLGLGGDNRLMVYLGGFGPHKNLEMLVRVFASLAETAGFDDVRLVLVGEHEGEVFYSQASALKQKIRKLGLEDRVIWTGYLADQELVVLLNCATLLALPSLMEGFGLPAVEAAACGCPVVATTASPLPELLGEGGIYVDPRAEQEWAATLKRVLESAELKTQMQTAGLAAAARLSWDAAAQQMQLVFEKVAAA